MLLDKCYHKCFLQYDVFFEKAKLCVQKNVPIAVVNWKKAK